MSIDRLEVFVKKAGLHTSLQDMGRLGYQALGVPVGGALDRLAYAQANWLVGNPPGTPVLEITLLGPELVFDSACQIAITGADLSPFVNGQAVDQNCTIRLPAGARLGFGRPKHGCRAYLAISGEWRVTRWLGSCTSCPGVEVVLPEAILSKGMTIQVDVRPSLDRRLPEHETTWIRDQRSIRILPGPEAKLLDATRWELFCTSCWKVDKDANRMGFRLGPAADFLEYQTSLLSSGVLPGTVQVTSGGQPIVLMYDGQTTGGYRRIAQIIAADLPAMAQKKPGDAFEFRPVSMSEARGAFRRMQEALDFKYAL